MKDEEVKPAPVVDQRTTPLFTPETEGGEGGQHRFRTGGFRPKDPEPPSFDNPNNGTR